MTTKLIEVGDAVYEVTATVGKEAFDAGKEKASRKLAQKVQINGFRKGKVPYEMAKKYINPTDLLNEAINECLPECYESVLKEHKLRPYGNPEVKNVGLSDEADGGFTVVFRITSQPIVELGQYKGIEVPLKVKKVSAKDVDAAVEKLLADNAELVLKDGPAALGDTVVFDFKGYIDGKEFDGGSADNYSLVLGSNQFIPGFEDQLVGVTSESKKDVNVTFPEQYVKDLAGKDAKFVCMVHEIKEKKVPELNEEFVESLNLDGVKTVDDLKKNQKAKLEAEARQEAQKDQFNEILDKICSNAKVVIPEKILEEEANNSKKELIGQIEQNGLSYEQYKEIVGQSDEEILAQFKNDAKTRLKDYFVISKVGEVENLVISRGELDQYYAQVAAQYNMKVEEVKKILSSNERNVVENLFQNKIQRFILANNGEVKKEAEEAKKEEPAAEKKATKAKAAKTKAADKKVEEAPAKEEKKPAKKATAKKTVKKEKEEKAE